MKPTVEIFTNVNELQSLIMHIFVYFMRRAGMEDLSNTVRVRRLTLAGHIPRLQSDRLASVAMQWVSDGGKRRTGCPRKTRRHTFQEDLQEMRDSWSGVRRA